MAGIVFLKDSSTPELHQLEVRVLKQFKKPVEYLASQP
jgi:hypothetical protein